MSSDYTNNSNTTLHDELAQQLGKLELDAPADSWRVEQVLKQSPSEVTQIVYLRLANDEELGPYVRKLVSPDAAAAGLGGAWAEFLHAQQAGARFSHLPRVISCERSESGLSVVMEYVPGPTVRELVLATPANEREGLAGRIVPGLCDAVTELHEKLRVPIVHRDITPSNVICSGSRSDEVVLVDLGIARAWKPGADTDTTHFGTRAYAAPEQFGFGQTDARTDVYALGLVAFFCLTGRDPTADDREHGFAAEGIPEAWRAVISRAAAFDPEQRFATAREMRNALSFGESPQIIGETPQMITASDRHSCVAPLAVFLKKVWRKRNFVIVPVMLLFIAASVSTWLSPSRVTQYPFWYDTFGYLVYMNYLILALGFVAMDKHWLREHVRFVGKRTTGQLVGAVALGLGLLTVILIAFTMFVDA